MPRGKRKSTKSVSTKDYRHEGTSRRNIPPASLAAEGKVPYAAKVRYHYSPHLPPVLRFDPGGSPDKLPELITEAGRRPLTAEEQMLLAQALRTHEPWLEWAGKHESDSVSEGRGFFEVDPVALHIHERVSAQAIIKVAARQDHQRDLFADPQQTYHEAVQFYRHDIDWTNRLILGDSLQVMSSLARREHLAGKVQMIYIDPPYGIKFASNFQSEVGRRSVLEKDSDLTREVEMVRAYRDTWSLGIHSYLDYLRQRMILARELLADTGSLFLQISDENVHVVRELLDDVFGPANFVNQIAFMKTAGLASDFLATVNDYLLWYARDRPHAKFRRLYALKDVGSEGSSQYTWADTPHGERSLSEEELASPQSIPRECAVFSHQSAYTTGGATTTDFEFEWQGRSFRLPPAQRWRTPREGMLRLGGSGRFMVIGNSLRYKRYLSDFPVLPITDQWRDTSVSGFAEPRRYVVQTNPKAIARCILMTTDPGDLVIDPTCGGGTTAYVAEQWGRRWITIDTSRVAIAIARQRLMTAKYDYYQFRDEKSGVAGGFRYGAVPHITLRSIAQNTNLDPIFAKHEPTLADRLEAVNAALSTVSDETRSKLYKKLLAKRKAEGKRAVSNADRRRWELPDSGKWAHWEVPFDTDPDWPKGLQDAVTAYRSACRSRADEVNACIAANAEQEELVDQPSVVKGVIRVSGPFTVEAVQPPELSLDAGPVFAGEPENLETGFASDERDDAETENARAYLREMVSLLRKDGVRFPNNQQMEWVRLEPLFESDAFGGIHAEGRWVAPGETDSDREGVATVGVVFGPQYGPVTAVMVEEVIKPAGRRYDDLVIAGFAFDGAAQAVIENPSHPSLRLHMAHIRPDVNPAMTGLLKEQPGSQLFTVFGQPRISIHGPGKKGTPTGEYVAEMEGVDVYDPVTNEIRSTKAEKVAAWFLDSDYDGRTFCITQAFFPDRSAWAKLAKALGGVVDADRFDAFSGTSSLPFPLGTHKRIAVKVIDPRGNEVMATRKLED